MSSRASYWKRRSSSGARSFSTRTGSKPLARTSTTNRAAGICRAAKIRSAKPRRSSGIHPGIRLAELRNNPRPIGFKSSRDWAELPSGTASFTAPSAPRNHGPRQCVNYGPGRLNQGVLALKSKPAVVRVVPRFGYCNKGARDNLVAWIGEASTGRSGMNCAFAVRKLGYCNVTCGGALTGLRTRISARRAAIAARRSKRSSR